MLFERFGQSAILGYLGRKQGYNAYAFELGLRVMERDLPTQQKLEAVRVMQLGLGDLVRPSGLDAVFEARAKASAGFDERVR